MRSTSALSAMLGLALSLVAVWLSVWAWSLCDYAYPLWYELLDIRAHIDRYAPQNIHVPHFHTLAAEAHMQAFAETVRAVHQHGHGLAEIQFRDVYGHLHPLYWRDEVLHLQDVARLLNTLAWAGQAALLLAVLLLWRLHLCREQPSWCALMAGPGSVLVVLLVSLLIWGFEPVFYQLHMWVFPPGHPWFFYYQDSLMSTLMKAPDLFAYLGMQVGMTAVVLFALMGWVTRRVGWGG